MDEYQNLTKTLGNIKKIADLIKKNAKIRNIKNLKSVPLLLETMQFPINKPQRRLPTPETGRTEKMMKIFKNLKKMQICSKKLLKFVIFKR